MAAVAATQKALDPTQQSIGTLKIENTDKRDALIASEKKYQQEWAEDKVFEMDAPSLKEVPFHEIAPAELRKKFPKYMVTMAYPYVNGGDEEFSLAVWLPRAVWRGVICLLALGVAHSCALVTS